MRKLSFLFLFAALSLISLTTFAQEMKEDVKARATEMIQEKVEIKLSELPEAVTKALGEEFAEYRIALQGSTEPTTSCMRILAIIYFLRNSA